MAASLAALLNPLATHTTRLVPLSRTKASLADLLFPIPLLPPQRYPKPPPPLPLLHASAAATPTRPLTSYPLPTRSPPSSLRSDPSQTDLTRFTQIQPDLADPFHPPPHLAGPPQPLEALHLLSSRRPTSLPSSHSNRIRPASPATTRFNWLRSVSRSDPL